MANETVKLIPNYIYFYHLDKYCILPLYPEQITDSMGSNFKETNALSRSAPVFTYVNSGPRSISLSFDLHRDMMNDVNKDISGFKENKLVDIARDDYVDVLIKYLQSASLPKYDVYKTGSKSVKPPMVAIRFGNSVFIRGVIKSAITVVYKKPIVYYNNEEKYAMVTINFDVAEVDPYDAATVADKGSFRGLISGKKDGANDIYK